MRTDGPGVGFGWERRNITEFGEEKPHPPEKQEDPSKQDGPRKRSGVTHYR